MSTAESVPKKKLPLAKLAIAAGVVALIGAVVLYFIGWRTAYDEVVRWFDAALTVMADAGPVIYFLAMAIIPAFGAPMFPFAAMASVVFRERMGLPVVILCGIAALTFNLSITYWLARRWLRPWLTRLLARFGYRLPEVESGDTTDLIVLLRVTPGVPFFVQNYLLGLANAPFGRYLAISCAIQWVMNAAFMLLGDALSQGRGKLAMTAILLLATVAVATHLVRKHMAKKSAA
jgi:uncharacterized membrane protein YdjX (TVP38/TMEM64 family)